jgi:cobalamin biosynthesis protein CbiG
LKLAIIAITKGGAALGRRIWESYPEGADLYLPGKFIMPGDLGAHALGDDLAGEVKRLFKSHKGLAFIMAAGIVVRLVAPLLKDKRSDPAVVVLDEGGQYVISLLSGHAGGANELAETLAGLIGAQPVITTASDVRDTLAVDTIASMLDCVVEDHNEAKKVTAAIVNGDSVSAYTDIDDETLADRLTNVPGNLHFHDSIDEVVDSERDAALVITPVVLSDELYLALRPVAVLRPKILVVGIGCNRGTTEEEIERLFIKTFREHGLSPLSVRNVATVSEKRDEAGLLGFADKNKLKIEFIPKGRLLKAATPSGPSEKVFEKMGVYGVCEPAALLSAGAKTLLVAKKKSKNVTIAVAMAAPGAASR